MAHPLDDPIWSALTGPNARFAIRRGKAIHFQRDVAPFSAIADPTEEAYADLAVDLPPGALARMFRPCLEPLPTGWEHVEDFPLLQMIKTSSGLEQAEGSAQVSTLTANDIPAMMELVSLTQPGPFEARTVELGLYVGIRERGELVAMAGERMRVAGFVELSAICTLPRVRNQGLAAVLVEYLVRKANCCGEVPFLHVARANIAAVSLYRKLGFETRRELHVLRRRPLARE
jgi:ribosomal protein S18 acetylase RimI-like enzyme